MTGRFKALTLDAHDHQAIADWWCRAIGYRRRDELRPPDPEDPSWARPLDWPVPIVDPDGPGPEIWVVAVPEDKTVKNRMHLDVYGVTADYVALGATVLRSEEEADDPLVEHDVLADPEGNEFCVFDPARED